jgi:hypothetical protein
LLQACFDLFGRQPASVGVEARKAFIRRAIA